MMNLEDIYDLDTITLEEKIIQLEDCMMVSSPRSKRRLTKILELAKLEVDERQAQELAQIFENKFTKFNFLYLNKQSTALMQPQQTLSSKPNSQSFTKATNNKLKQSTKKVFTIPKMDQIFRYKPIKQKTSLPALKKISSISKPRASLKLQQQLNSKKRTMSIVNKLNEESCKTPMINKKTATITPLKHSSIPVSEIKTQQSKPEHHQRQPTKVINKVQYIQNEHSISSNQQSPQQDEIFQPQLIIMHDHQLQSLNGVQQMKQSGGSIQISQLNQTTQTNQVNEGKPSAKQDPIQKQVVQMKEQIPIIHIDTPVYQDSIDYFRFAVVKKKPPVEIIEEKKYVFNLNIQVSQSKFEQVDILQQQNSSNPSQISSEDICKTQRVHQEQTRAPLPIRPITQYNNKKKLKPLVKIIPKIIKQLPVPTMTYHDVIPTFNHLFYPNADVFSVMRMFIGILGQHLNIQKKQINREFNVDYHSRQYLIQKFGHLVNIELTSGYRYSSQQIDEQNKESCLYYRVVKTKEQVYDIITHTFLKTNWVELPHGLNLKQSWNLLWTWAKPQIDFQTLIYFQKVNHFLNNKHLSRKDLLKKNIQKIKRLGAKIGTVFDIIPDTYLLPGETDAFVKKFTQYTSEKQNIWIMKPIGLSRGRGIRLITNLEQVYYNQPVILQRYLTRPFLLDGTKFDMRIYVVVTNMNPLQAFIYKQGFARLSTEKYSLQDLDNNFIHLTNFSIQRQNLKPNESVGGSKISLKSLRKQLESKGVDWNSIWNQITQIVLKSLIACMNQIPSIPNCFQLFGYDIIIDSKLKCWLLQINSSPSLQKQFPLDELIKQQLTDDIVKLINPVKFNRLRLKEVLERRVMEIEGRKSYINTNNNSIHQLNQDICYILNGQPLAKYGEREGGSNFIKLAPSEGYFKIVKTLQSYKNTNIIKNS